MLKTKSKPLKLNQVVIANISLNNIMKEKLQSGEMGREKKKGEVISAQRKKKLSSTFLFFFEPRVSAGYLLTFNLV